MFKDYRRTPAGSEVKLIVETHQGTAGIEISKDGHPLTAAERQAEDARLENYVDNPDALSKKRKQEKEDADHSARIMRALPDAFLYTPAGTESGSATVGHPGDELLVFNFRPNPNYNPPTHVEQVLTGMKGQVLIDARENRIAEINGTLEKEVGFGWGILGHLDPGGKFFVQQADVGDYHWEVTHMQLSFTGRILFFKKLSIHSNDIFTDFHPVGSDLTFAQAVKLLQKEAAQLDAGGLNGAKSNTFGESARARSTVKSPAETELCCGP